MAWSASASAAQDRPRSRSLISVLTAATAPRTPFALVPVRVAVAALDRLPGPGGGTGRDPGRAVVPSASRTVTASVGRPRESRISSADRSVTLKAAVILSRLPRYT